MTEIKRTRKEISATAKARRDAIVAYRESGLKLQEIADKYGISKTSICAQIAKAKRIERHRLARESARGLKL